jgi:CubicO group peptidase (beta-lactamase class C family)
MRLLDTIVRLVGFVPLAACIPLAGPAAVAAGDGPRDLGGRVEALRERADVPALAVVLYDDERTLARGISGRRSTERDAPVTWEDRFHLGSLSKAMTATVAASLVEEGKIAWSTTLAEVCTGSRAIPEPYRKVTLEQLLAHRSGLPDDRHGLYGHYTALWEHGGTLTRTRHDGVAASFALDGLTGCGAGFTYSNSGYMIAGHMLEEVTGEPFERLMRERLFEPLGMAHAGFGEPVEEHGDAEPRGHVREGGTLTPAPRGSGGALPLAMDPAGGVHCTAEELASFARAHLAGLRGRGSVVTAESFRHLHADPEHDGYALGWGLDAGDAGAVVSRHAGSNMRWFAIMSIDPSHNRGLIAVMNAVPREDVDLFAEIGGWYEASGAEPEAAENGPDDAGSP